MGRLLSAMAMGIGLLLAGCATLGARQAGQSVALVRDDSSIRGSAYGRPFSLQWDDTGVKGSYRALPVKLAVGPAGDATRVDGEFDGETAAFRYAPDRIEGYLSGCTFILKRAAANRFEGYRACPAKRLERLTVAIPLQLASRSEAERAAWLAVLLTNESVEQPFARAQLIASVERARLERSGCCNR